MGEYLKLVESTLLEWAKKDDSVDKSMATELELHIHNTAQHHNQLTSIHNRLDQIKAGKRVKRDTITGQKHPFDPKKAHKAFRNVVDAAARDYHGQNGGSSSHGTREQVAANLFHAYDQGITDHTTVSESTLEESRRAKTGEPGSKKREVHIKMQAARLMRKPQPFAGPEGDYVDKTIRKNVIGKSWKNRVPPNEDK